MRSKGRPDKRARTSDSGKMVAEENPLVGGYEVAAIVEALARSGACVVQCEHFSGNKRGIEPVRDEITTDRGNDEPGRVEGFSAIKCDLGKCSRAKQGNKNPNDDDEESLHFAGFAAALDLMNCGRLRSTRQ